jgi:hypothetical protein
MRKDLLRRLESLERQLGVADFETKLRSFARRLGEDEEAYLRAVRDGAARPARGIPRPSRPCR